MTAAAIFLCCSVSVYAAQSEYANADKLYSRNGDESIYISEDNFLYNFKGEQPGVSICGYVGESTDITIPHIINGREVSAIYKDSFAGNETLESVSFPNSIKEIGANCFNGCTKLTTVKLATGVNQFEDVFCDCPALESMVAHLSGRSTGSAVLLSSAMPLTTVPLLNPWQSLRVLYLLTARLTTAILSKKLHFRKRCFISQEALQTAHL